jgi:hypothetical protein
MNTSKEKAMTQKQVAAAKVRAFDTLKTAAWAIKDLARRSGESEELARITAAIYLRNLADRIIMEGM